MRFSPLTVCAAKAFWYVKRHQDREATLHIRTREHQLCFIKTGRVAVVFLCSPACLVTVLPRLCQSKKYWSSLRISGVMERFNTYIWFLSALNDYSLVYLCVQFVCMCVCIYIQCSIYILLCQWHSTPETNWNRVIWTLWGCLWCLALLSIKRNASCRLWSHQIRLPDEPSFLNRHPADIKVT